MLRKVLALFVAAVMLSVTVYAQMYEELPFVPGQPPPEARPGEAWCIFVYPAEYETVVEQVLVRPEMTVMKPILPEYGQETREFECVPAYSVGTPRAVQFAEREVQIECVPAHKALRVIPAQFRDAQKEVEVCPAYMEKYWVPAEFATETAEFVITPERKELRKVQCVDGTNIDCFTVVGAPAQTQTVEIKRLVRDGYVAERPVAAQMQLIPVKELIREAYVEEQIVPAQMGTFRAAYIVQESSMEIRQVPAQLGRVTSMTILRDASIMPEIVPAVYQEQARQVLKTPERPVWRKQLLNQMQQISYTPMPAMEVAAESIMQDYSSIPGVASFRIPRAP